MTKKTLITHKYLDSIKPNIGVSIFSGHKSKGKKRGSVTYSTDRENEVSKIFIISLQCAWGAQERSLFTRNGFKFLNQVESKTIQSEIVFLSR